MLGLLVVGETVNVSSMIGLVALFGICAQNDILRPGKISDLRREGPSLRDAVLEGSRVRFRPILMTDPVMIVGVLPLSALREHHMPGLQPRRKRGSSLDRGSERLYIQLVN
jgi:heavy metal efflux system protein